MRTNCFIVLLIVKSIFLTKTKVCIIAANKGNRRRFMTRSSEFSWQPGSCQSSSVTLKRAPRSSNLQEPNLQSSLLYDRSASDSGKMRTCVLHCCLTLLGLSLLLCCVSSQPDLDPQHRRLLQRPRALGVAVQKWTKNDLKDILSQLTLPEAEFQESDISTLGTKQDLTVELERSAEDPNSIPPRERKAGCNFYWKGFTSC